jgi:hypothetical protein
MTVASVLAMLPQLWECGRCAMIQAKPDLSGRRCRRPWVSFTSLEASVRCVNITLVRLELVTLLRCPRHRISLGSIVLEDTALLLCLGHVFSCCACVVSAGCLQTSRCGSCNEWKHSCTQTCLFFKNIWYAFVYSLKKHLYFFATICFESLCFKRGLTKFNFN